MSDDDLDVVVATGLEDADKAAVRELAEAAERADGISPLDDQVRLDLDAVDEQTHRHVLARDRAGALVGYAHLDTRAPTVATAHFVTHPTRRRAGHGRRLAAELAALNAERQGSALRAWAHGDLPPAVGLAEALGWAKVRELFQLRLPIEASLADASYPSDVTVREFVVGEDEAAWVAVNSAAFAQHAEQGRATVDDLRQRERQDWFDPAGFFLAERAGQVVGFHWTKVHPASPTEPAVGEVYVVGVDPAAQGSGLGKALTLTGVHHLRERGLDVILYVDGENTAARAVYDRIGFEQARADVMYEQPA